MVADLTFYQSVPGLIDALPDDARAHAGGMRMGGAEATIAALRLLAKRWSHPSDSSGSASRRPFRSIAPARS